MRVSSLVVCMSISMSPPFLQPSQQLWRRACACERVALTRRVYAIILSLTVLSMQSSFTTVPTICHTVYHRRSNSGCPLSRLLSFAFIIFIDLKDLCVMSEQCHSY